MGRRHVTWALGLLAVLVPWHAWALDTQSDFRIIDGFESKASSSTAATHQNDPLTWVQHLTGGAVEGDIALQATILRNNTNGGHSTSFRTPRATTTVAARSPWYTLNFGLDGKAFDHEGLGYEKAAATLHVHIASVAASGERAFFGFAENLAWTDWGCFLEVTAGRVLKLNYHAGNGTEACTTDAMCNDGDPCNGSCTCETGTGMCIRNISSGDPVILQNACAVDPTLPCTVDGDCPSGTCTAKYFAAIELVQKRFGFTEVACELYVDSRRLTQVSNQITVALGGIDTVKDVAVGFPPIGTKSGGSTWDAYFDDFILNTNQTDPRSGAGYLVTYVPTADSTDQAWFQTNCTATAQYDCIDDFLSGGELDNTGATQWVRSLVANKSDAYCAMTTPTVTLTTGQAIKAVDVQVFTEPGSPANLARDITLQLMMCPFCEEDGASGAADSYSCTSGLCKSDQTGTSTGQTCVVDSECQCSITPMTGHCSLTTTTPCVVGNECPLGETCKGGSIYYTTNSGDVFFLGHMLVTNPPQSTTPDWTPAALNQLGFGFKTAMGTCSVTTTTVCDADADCSGAETCVHGFQSGSGNQIQAVLAYAYVQRPDAASARYITLGDHNKGAEDGLRSIMLHGDSTLIGTSSGTCCGGTTPGSSCNQESYCSWDTEFKDRPTGGCGNNDVTCQTCTSRRQTANAGAGYPCVNDGQCTGTCSSGTCTTAAAPDWPCTQDSECEFGTCDEAATCVDACPDGVNVCGSTGGTTGACIGGINTGLFGWSKGFRTRVGADVVGRCAQGGATAAQGYAIVAGLLEGKLIGTCSAERGTGKCECTVATETTDCGGATLCKDRAGASCDAGEICMCHGAAGGKSACVAGKTSPNAASACATGRACYLPPADLIVSMYGHNDQNLFDEGVPGTQPNPHCDSPKFSIQNGDTESWLASATYRGDPDLPCPTIGNDHPLFGSAYKCNATACNQNTDCAGVAPNSVCLGTCSTFDAQCMNNLATDGTYPNCGPLGQCTEWAPECNHPIGCQRNLCNASSTNAGVACNPVDDKPCVGGGADCVANTAMTCSGVTSPLDAVYLGVCVADADSDCPPGYKQFQGRCWKTCTTTADCTRNCTTAADCGPGGGCTGNECVNATATCNTTDGICRGVCSCPCQAIACTTDAQCGGLRVGPGGHDEGAHPGFDRLVKLRGTCNPDAGGGAGRCACCGYTTCGDPLINPDFGGGCSCTTSADCKIGDGTCAGGVCVGTTVPCSVTAECDGLCTDNVCQLSQSGGVWSKRGLCGRDGDCARGKKCINCQKQFRQWRAGYQRSSIDVWKQMQRDVYALNEGCECNGTGDCSPTCTAGKCAGTRERCEEDADCTGTCTSGECATGPRAACQTSSECATDFGCLAPHLLFSSFLHIGGEGPPSALNILDAPIRECSPYRITDLTMNHLDDEQWWFLANELEQDGDFPDHLVALLRQPNRDRVATAYHIADGGHYNSIGSDFVGNAIGDRVNALNVCTRDAVACTNGLCAGTATPCVTAAECLGTPQKYCRKPNAAFAVDTNCPGGSCECPNAGDGTCDAAENCECTCEEDSDCIFVCTTRPCDQNATNCPATGDSCGPD